MTLDEFNKIEVESRFERKGDFERLDGTQLFGSIAVNLLEKLPVSWKDFARTWFGISVNLGFLDWFTRTLGARNLVYWSLLFLLGATVEDVIGITSLGLGFRI